ncbi:hypothetical protein F0562_017232 [Nyssa sinensis]|uniref:Uncharacterized protein n=1 Tax=Nyssa sinensis TaxID=561372 RepID=A0A5J4ZEL2_9ASTE|nr:hypothetical protein F0562_017232 [Nyssa sinensis]
MICSMAQVGSFMPKTMLLMPTSKPSQPRKITICAANQRPQIKPGTKPPQTNGISTSENLKIKPDRVPLTREDDKKTKDDNGSVVTSQVMDSNKS